MRQVVSQRRMGVLQLHCVPLLRQGDSNLPATHLVAQPLNNAAFKGHFMSDTYQLPNNFQIVSGGQTGADLAALDWAIAHGVLHGGWCPKGRRSEDGLIDKRYLLRETPSRNYLERTEWNLRDSDATVIFTLTDELDGGSKRTAQLADKLGKPWIHMRPGVHPKFMASFLSRRNIAVLNVAGKRESAAPGIGEFVQNSLSAALEAQDGTGS